MPLPPYIRREPGADDDERYQTVFARKVGAVAAPTAGLHFDDALLQALRERGVQFGHVTLHVRSEEHTSELQSLMRISYAGFCLKKKKKGSLTPTKRHIAHHT